MNVAGARGQATPFMHCYTCQSGSESGAGASWGVEQGPRGSEGCQGVVRECGMCEKQSKVMRDTLLGMGLILTCGRLHQRSAAEARGVPGGDCMQPVPSGYLEA